MIRSAAAYLFKNKIFIRGYAITTDGLRTGHGDISVDDTTDCAGIGCNMLKMLDKAGTIIPHPQTREEMMAEGKQVFAQLLDAIGIKTLSVFAKKVHCVSLRLENDQVTMTPAKYGTPQFRRGYIFLENKALTSPLDPETLGRTLIQAFELCE